jgi:hypothetical protein
MLKYFFYLQIFNKIFRYKIPIVAVIQKAKFTKFRDIELIDVKKLFYFFNFYFNILCI